MNKSINLVNEQDFQEAIASVGKCVCITNAGAACSKSGAWRVVVEYRTITAYARGCVPMQSDGAQFSLALIPVCPVHKKTLACGNAVKIQTLTDKDGVYFHNNKEDNEMELPFHNLDTAGLSDYMHMWEHVRLFTKVETNALIDHFMAPEGLSVEFYGRRVNDVDLMEALSEWQKDTAHPDHPENEVDAYDLEHSMEVALKKLEGQPFSNRVFPHGGYLLIEKCGHDHCQFMHLEAWHECANMRCCENPNCDHYTVWLCEQHKPNPRYVKCGACKGYHPTAADVKACYEVKRQG